MTSIAETHAGRPDAARAEWRRNGHLVALTAIGLTCAPTTLAPYTIGLFVVPLHAEFGWSRGAIQGAITFSTGLGVIAAPMAGAMVRRFGVRATILSGLLGLALCFAAASTIGGALWQFYTAYAGMALLGAGAGGVAWNTLLTARFAASRGLALGIGLSGTGICSIVMPQVAAWAIESWGWRAAYLSLAAIAFAVVLPLCVLLLPKEGARDLASDAEPVVGLSAPTAVRTGRFWLLGLATAAIYVAIGGAIPNLVPLLIDSGLSATRAASVMGLFGAAIIVGRIGVGALVDRFWAPGVALCVLLTAASGCLIVATAPGYVGAALAAMLIGVAAGTELDLLGFLVGRYFGLADFARIYGRLFAFVAVAAGVAPPLFGYARDISGSYAPAFFLAAALLAAGAAGLLALGPYPRLRD